MKKQFEGDKDFYIRHLSDRIEAVVKAIKINRQLYLTDRRLKLKELESLKEQLWIVMRLK